MWEAWEWEKAFAPGRLSSQIWGERGRIARLLAAAAPRSPCRTARIKPVCTLDRARAGRIARGLESPPPLQPTHTPLPQRAARSLHHPHAVPAHVHHEDAGHPPVADGATTRRRVLEALFSPVLTLFAGGENEAAAATTAAPPLSHTHAAIHHRAAAAAEQQKADATLLPPSSSDRDSDTALAVADDSEAAALPPPAALPTTTSSSDDSAACDDDFIEFDPYAFIKALPPLTACVTERGPPLLPARTRAHGERVTLVLDLDETLVHSTLGPIPPPGADFSFDVALGGRTHGVHVRTRPHLETFLNRVADLFEVVVFTASQKVYAERLLNELDPSRRLIRHRVFRDACVIVDGNYLKDLTVLGRDLARVVIVDNSPQAFGFQLDNGVPIESWYDDAGDAELVRLLPLLEALATATDVRPLLANAFQLRRMVERAPSLEPLGL